jgi:hypothetical protein
LYIKGPHVSVTAGHSNIYHLLPSGKIHTFCDEKGKKNPYLVGLSLSESRLSSTRKKITVNFTTPFDATSQKVEWISQRDAKRGRCRLHCPSLMTRRGEGAPEQSRVSRFLRGGNS